MSGKKLLAGYLVAGYPDRNRFLNMLPECDKAGTDIFELGFPSENPSHDGEIIQKAHRAADKNACNDLSYWKEIRERIHNPIWLMGYRKELIDSGLYKTLAQKGLIDALVMPELSCEENTEIRKEVAAFGVDVMECVHPGMGDKELRYCFSHASLIYQQLYSGPTGMAVETDDYRELLEKGRAYQTLSLFAGFGIHTPERVYRLLLDGFDGVVIGTAMIRQLNLSETELLKFIAELHSAVEKAGETCEVHRHS